MTIAFDLYRRLETRSNDRDLQRGFSAPIHDPVWFLARQWQMGEHRGENATTPVVATYEFEATPIEAPTGVTLDPLHVPAEMIVESELDDWWTIGRRVRIGHRVAEEFALHNGPAAALPDGARFHHPPPPYERFDSAFDGRALWRLVGTPGLTADLFGPPEERPPADTRFNWLSDQFYYRESFPTAERPLTVERHRGGALDWYSADGDNAVALEPVAGPAVTERVVIPTPLEYPGAPHSRWWEIEDGTVDIGGYPPDAAHFATMLLVELVFSHGDDWFLFPVTAPAGHVVTISQVVVRDSFDRNYASTEAQWADALGTPTDWSTFATNGLRPASLVLWSIAELPLEGPVIERVQFGTDEQSNLVWAVERVVDSREVDARASRLDGEPADPFPDPVPSTDLDQPRRYQYVPGRGFTERWHPYLLVEDEGRMFVQGGLADFSRQTPFPMPPPEAEVLQGGTPDQRELHRIAPAALPSQGIEIERRWMLARDDAGNPVLWTQRQRKPLRSPPGRTLRYDVLEETAPRP